MIEIDIEYTPNIFVDNAHMIIKHFTTVVAEIKDVHCALIECITFLTKQGNTYLNHHIILSKEEP